MNIPETAEVTTAIPTPVITAPCTCLINVPTRSPIPAEAQMTSSRKPTAYNTPISVLEKRAPQARPTAITRAAAKQEKAASPRILPTKSFRGLMGIDINFASKPFSLSAAILAGRLAMPAIIKAKTNMEIVVEPLRYGTISLGAPETKTKLPMSTHTIGQAIVQNSTARSLRNSFIVLLKAAAI